jgi:hypothetical protein
MKPLKETSTQLKKLVPSMFSTIFRVPQFISRPFETDVPNDPDLYSACFTSRNLDVSPNSIRYF